MVEEVSSRSISTQTRAARRIRGPVAVSCCGRMAGPSVSTMCGPHFVGGTGRISDISVAMM